MKIVTPFSLEAAAVLRAGDSVLISGEIYTARDAAHKRMITQINDGASPPFDLENKIIYYAGPCPARPGRVIGSCGPTTSGRMDAYTPQLLDLGLRGMIGKGERAPEVIEAMKRNNAVYFAAIGGAGALLASRVVSAEAVAFEDLGAEAVFRLMVEDFPVIVAIDAEGNSLYGERA